MFALPIQFHVVLDRRPTATAIASNASFANQTTIILGALLSVSESLPFVTKIKANGIFDAVRQVVVSMGKTAEEQEKKKEQETHSHRAMSAMSLAFPEPRRSRCRQ